MLSVFVYRAVDPLDLVVVQRLEATNLMEIKTEEGGDLKSLWPGATNVSFRFAFDHLSVPEDATNRACERAVNAALNAAGVPYLVPRRGSSDMRRLMAAKLEALAVLFRESDAPVLSNEASQQLFDAVRVLSAQIDQLLLQRR